MHPSTDNLAFMLEQYIDTHSVPVIGVANVLDTLQEICAAKAEHLRANWQDEASAKSWERVSRPLDAARARIEKMAK